MENKTPMYILIIVGIVALVAVVNMLTVPSVNTGIAVSSDNGGNLMTGNVVLEDMAPVNYSGFWRFVMGTVLIGACVYAYRKEI